MFHSGRPKAAYSQTLSRTNSTQSAHPSRENFHEPLSKLPMALIQA